MIQTKEQFQKFKKKKTISDIDTYCYVIVPTDKHKKREREKKKFVAEDWQ